MQQIEKDISNFEDTVLCNNEAYIISYLPSKEEQTGYDNYGVSSLYGELPELEVLVTNILTNLINAYCKEGYGGEDIIGERLNNILDEAYYNSYLYEEDDE